MKLKVKRIDPGLPLPEYQTAGSVAFDLLAREDTEIAPQSVALIPGNLIVQVPEGYVLLLASRSSTPIKKGLSTPHGIGITDQDYHGPGDELRVQVFNFTNESIRVKRGDRVAQALIVPVVICELVETEEAITTETRGSFGSTG